MLDRLRSLRGHQVSRNASWLVAGQLANFLLQAIFFVLLTRLLGVNEFGIFSGALALITVATPYSSLGTGMLFMRYVSLDRSQAGLYWGNALVVTTSVTLLIAVVFSFAGPAVTHTQSHMIFFILAFANCLFSQVSDLGNMVFQTFEKMRYTAALSFLANLARVLSLLIMRAALHQATALQWSIGVLIAYGVAAAATFVWVRRVIGPLRIDLRMVRRHSLEGLGFSFAGTTQNAYNDIDKTMLSHYGLNRENGFYSLAYRIVDFASTPIVAIDSAILPRLFQRSRESLAKTFRLAFRSAALTSSIGLVAAVGILLLGPWVLRLVPRSFAGAMTALHWLCWLPPLRGIHRLTGGALTASGRQSWRTASQFTVAGVNLLLNVWWIPAYGWIGAAWASVAADGSLAILNSMLLLVVWSRLPQPGSAVEMEAAKP
jgi:O-antigen/teichoic acid export membrane protein